MKILSILPQDQWGQRKGLPYPSHVTVSLVVKGQSLAGKAQANPGPMRTGCCG